MPIHAPQFVQKLWAYCPAWPGIRQAIQATAAAILAYELAAYFALPQGYWAVMTAILVVQSSVGGSLGLAIDRFLATLLGAAVGGALLAAAGAGYGIPVPLGLGVLILTYAATLRASMRLAPVTAAVVILAEPINGSAFASAVNRVCEIGIGAGVAVAISLLLFPSRARIVLAAHVGTVLPMLAEHLKGTIGAALGTPRDGDAFLAFNDSIRAKLIAGGTLVSEAQREAALQSSGYADPAAILRTLRRLWYTSVAAARAARAPLPPAVLPLLEPALVQLRDAAVRYIEQLAQAFAAQAKLPDRQPVDGALTAMDAAMDSVRQTGVARTLSTDEVARLFAFTFALRQLGVNLEDLEDRCAELRSNFKTLPAK